MSILLSYVPSESGNAAAGAAIAEAKAHGALLIVVNAVRGGALVDQRVATESALRSIVDRAREAGVQATVEQPESPDVVDALLDLITQHEARMVVIGTRHRSPVGKLVTGSTAQRILLDSPCPVLAVKAPAD
ncbi:universal stress protein [Nocardioides houyundeii]|uniref:universal stress protein n=1 Tax=Nocardioides houyundeii TaxID=2045452 RepID=UPI000DF1DE93|nr:universal stress protein [Nocardioides houyundeii]